VTLLLNFLPGLAALPQATRRTRINRRMSPKLVPLADVVAWLAGAMTDFRLAAAKGSSDPTVRLGVGCKPWYAPSITFSVSIPFRTLDHNQGGRRDTHLDIDRKARLRNAGRVLILGDVDCAYAGMDRAAALFKPYRDGYPRQASGARETIAFSLQQGAASLPDSAEEQADYRRVQVNRLNLMAADLKAANQLNLAVACEVTP
jgi:hypothetical protein